MRLAPGDLIFTGTPEGVAAVQRGDVLEGDGRGRGDGADADRLSGDQSAHSVVDAVGGEHPIGGDDHQVFEPTLCDQQSVEWIAMRPGQGARGSGVCT